MLPISPNHFVNFWHFPFRPGLDHRIKSLQSKGPRKENCKKSGNRKLLNSSCSWIHCAKPVAYSFLTPTTMPKHSWWFQKGAAQKYRVIPLPNGIFMFPFSLQLIQSMPFARSVWNACHDHLPDFKWGASGQTWTSNLMMQLHNLHTWQTLDDLPTQKQWFSRRYVGSCCFLYPLVNKQFAIENDHS